MLWSTVPSICTSVCHDYSHYGWTLDAKYLTVVRNDLSIGESILFVHVYNLYVYMRPVASTGRKSQEKSGLKTVQQLNEVWNAEHAYIDVST